LKTVNGGISVSDIRGSLRFEATNGGIHLRRLAGDVTGATVNGGVNLELMGTTAPGNYSAQAALSSTSPPPTEA
jgi:DUF4097 and DUF4098 domain-containing protein YvlB